jgi:hypothetical protein
MRVQWVSIPFQASVVIDLSSPSWCNLWFSRLRSMTFNFEPESLTRLQRVFIVERILAVSPRLSHLVVAWDDLRHCSQVYPKLKHLHLVLYRRFVDPNKYVHVGRLVRLVPGLCCLETSRGETEVDQNLVTFVLNIIDTFHQLVKLTINEDGLYPPKPEAKLSVEQAILASGNKRLLDSTTFQIVFFRRNTLKLWL